MTGGAAELRLAFMGSPEFAVPTLQALHDAGHEIAAVYCQPPRPAGRGQSVRRCAVQVRAEALGLPVRTPARVRRDAAEHAMFAALQLDAAIVAAYGLILPPAMLDAPRRGCINVHASLLPRWRGAAPIQAAILAGDGASGVTIMQMDAGLDTGPMLLRGEVAVAPRMTTPELHDALAELAPRLLLRVLAQPPDPVPQPPEGATYAEKLTRDSARLDWTLPAATLDRRVRALNPWPSTVCRIGADLLKVLSAEPVAGVGEPGTVLDGALSVACGDGALRLLRIQAPGRAAMAAADFLRGRSLPPGARLG